MDNYLLDNGLSNVWCTPDQDDQLIFKLARLTPFDGAINTYHHHWDYIPLPEKSVRFHVYHIGQISPALINLLDTRDDLDRQKWESFKDVCNNKLTTVNLYVDYGIELPRFNSYYMITKTNDVLIAIKRNSFYKFNIDYVYFRTYLNSYFSSIRQVVDYDYVKTNGVIVSNTNDILSIQNEVNILKAKTGYVTCTVNGYKQSTIDLTNSKIGDVIEYFYDSSIKKLVTLTISTLQTFDSELDKKGKYLIHYPGLTNIIDYQDDIDIYLIQKSTGKGVYIHKNMKDTFRNITHKDYSLVTSYVNDDFYHFKDSNGMIDTTDLAIELHVRNSGYSRNLIYEVNRINELYKLPNNKIVEAMVGVNSTVDVWKAVNLEQCAYINLMKSKYSDINIRKVTDAYGYNSIAYMFGNNVQLVKLVDGIRKVDVPYLYRTNSTAFEYDSDGLLIDFYQLNAGQTYVCHNPANYVEFIYGLGGDLLDEYINSNVNIGNNEYRAYLKQGNTWKDVTGSDFYYMVGTTITWKHSLLANTDTTLIRTLNKFVCLKKTVDFNNGRLTVPFTYRQNIDNQLVNMITPVNMGSVDVFLNGKSLIEGIDFYYDNHSVVIVNKSYLISNVPQNVIIRLTGFCDDKLQLQTRLERGFIQNGNVSDDHRFEIKDGIVTRVIVDGKLMLSNSVSYYEDAGVGTTYNNLNGKPYQIAKPLIPVKSLTGVDTYSIFDNENETDSKINDYLTINVNQISPPGLSVNTTKHYLYSPFLSNIIDDLVDGTINSSTIPERINSEDVTRICAPYEHLLLIDPIFEDNYISKDYVIVHVHPYSDVINLNVNQYRLLENIISIYARDKIDLVNQIKLI